MSPGHNEIVRKELDKMLDAGEISPTILSWAFPLIIPTKKDGKQRFCVDYGALNHQRWSVAKDLQVFVCATES